MYRLILTRDERQAVDWVGHRYRHGYELYKLLHDEAVHHAENVGWSEDADMVFLIPEHVAWGVKEICEEGGYALDCFADPLKAKLVAFCSSVI